MLGIERLAVRAAFVVSYWAALSVACAVVCTSGWSEGWKKLGVPAMPTFADMRTVQAAVAQRTLTADAIARLHLTDRWQRSFNYPDVWIEIGQALHITDERCYLASIYALIALLVTACSALLFWRPSIWTLLYLCSFPFALAIERGSNEMAVFVLLMAGTLLARAWLLGALVFVASVLKVFPIFALPALLGRRTVLVAAGLATTVYWALHHDQLSRIRAATPASPSVSYGLSSATLAVYYKLGVSLAVAHGVVLLAMVATCALVFVSRRFRQDIARAPAYDRELSLFLAGAGIYVFSFLTASNWDYRLIFLVFCFPHVDRALHAPVQRALGYGSVFVAGNQLWLMDTLGRALGGGLNVLAKIFLFAALACALLQTTWTRYGLLEEHAQPKT